MEKGVRAAVKEISVDTTEKLHFSHCNTISKLKFNIFNIFLENKTKKIIKTMSYIAASNGKVTHGYC